MRHKGKETIKKAISYLIGFGILMLYWYIGLLAVKVLALKFPPALTALVLLCISLQFKKFPKKYIKDISELMIKHIALFVIPLTVGIGAYTGLIKNNIFKILFIVFVATFISFTLTALLVENIIKYNKLKKIKAASND